jgi:flavin-dependent dehydrogenase
VLLLDRGEFPRDKACGDGIAPHAFDVLDQIGAPGMGAGYAPVHGLRLGFHDGRWAAGRMRRPAHVVPRQVFDARIRAAALARGATPLRHRVRHVEQRTDRVVVDGTIEARVVVAADGAESVVRRVLVGGRAPAGSTALALRGYAPVRSELAGSQAIAFGSSGAWPSYAWSFPIGDGRANVGYGEVLQPGMALSRRLLLDRLDELLPGVAEGGTAWRAAHLPLSTGRPRQPAGRVLLSGDALSLVNPLTGEGIYYAVLSGSIAGRSSVVASRAAVDPGQVYRVALRRVLAQHLRHTSVAARLARGRRVVIAGVDAARTDPRVLDDIVELGLGHGLLTRRAVAGLGRSLVRDARPAG